MKIDENYVIESGGFTDHKDNNTQEKRKEEDLSAPESKIESPK